MNEMTVHSHEINNIAHEINLIKDQANKFLLQSSIEIGKRLKEAKEIVGHGNWTQWLVNEVNYSQRTASNLIKIYDEYGPLMVDSANSQALANLGYTQAIAMLKLDFKEREDFIIENDIENMTTRELSEAIKEKEELQKEKESLEKQLKEQEEKEGTMAKEIELKLKHILLVEKELKVKNQEAIRLRQELESQEETHAIDPKDYERVQEDLQKKKAEIKQLKNKLKEKPKEIEIEVEKVVETIPEEVKKEIDGLRKKLELTNNKLNDSESKSKFRATFNVLVNLFNNLLETLGDIKKNDPTEYNQYKDAINKLLEKLIIKE